MLLLLVAFGGNDINETMCFAAESDDHSDKAAINMPGIKGKAISMFLTGLKTLVKGAKYYKGSGSCSIASFVEKPKAEDKKGYKDTPKDMEIPEPSYVEHVGKSARVDLNHDCDEEEREHYLKIQKYQLHSGPGG